MYQKEAQLQLPQLLRASAHFLWGEEVTRKTGTFVAQAGKRRLQPIMIVCCLQSALLVLGHAFTRYWGICVWHLQ